MVNEEELIKKLQTLKNLFGELTSLSAPEIKLLEKMIKENKKSSVIYLPELYDIYSTAIKVTGTTMGIKSLIEDIINMYKEYCKERNIK